MELRSGRFVDDIPVLPTDFDLFARAEDIGDFDGFTARDVHPNADPNLAVELVDQEYFGFAFQEGDTIYAYESGSEFDPADLSDSDSTDSWDEPVRVPSKRKAVGTGAAADAGTKSTRPMQLCVDVPRLSESTKALYRPLSLPPHAARHHGRVISLGEGRVIRMAPERVTRFEQRRSLRRTREREARQADVGKMLDAPRPAKVPRVEDLPSQSKRNITHPVPRPPQAGSSARKGSDAAPSTAPLKVKTDAQRERARLRRQKQRARGGPNAVRAAHYIKQAVHVESKIDVKSHVTGKSAFTAPSKFREEQLKSSTSSAATPSKLHPDVSTMVRDLVEKQGALYVAADDRGIIMTDSQGRIYCVKPPASQDPGFLDAQRHCGQELNHLQQHLDIRHSDNTANTNTRGHFSKIQVGTSFGGGQTQPTRFSTDIGGDGKDARRSKRQDNNRRLLVKFLKDKKVRRVVKHAQTCAENAFPEVMEEYRQLNEDLKLNDAFRLDDEEDDDPSFNYYFAAMTFNLGPQVATIFHRDAMNLQQGICTIMAFGEYDARTSGHFIMKEPNVVVEFRPGDIIFVMSALITHGNAPLKPHENRASWTFYTAGGLFRWRAAGERCLNTLTTEEEKRTYLRAAKSWSDLAWANLLTVAELASYFARAAL